MKEPDYLFGSLMEAKKYKSNSLMIFLGSPQNSLRKNIVDLKYKEFENEIKINSFNKENIIVHGSYLTNLGNLDEQKFAFSLKVLMNDVRVMEKLGLEKIVIHPGNYLKSDKIDSLNNIIKGLDFVFENTKKIKILLETMPGKGTQLCSNFDEISYLIKNSKQKERLGVC
jgi:deoxyribonuclease-4